MFYWLYEQLSAGGHIPVFNLFKYLTFRTGMSLFTAQIVVVALGSRFIRWIQAKQGRGQPIRAEGIQRHIVEKAGTPTMGGVMILAGLLGGTLLWADLSNPYVWAVIIVTAGYGVLGFLDDYAKVTKQTTEGISGRVRLLLEFVIAFAAVAIIILFGAKPPESPHLLTSVAFPLFKQWVIDLNWFYLLPGPHHRGRRQRGELHRRPRRPGHGAGDDRRGRLRPDRLPGRQLVFANYLQLHFVPGVGEVAVYAGP